MPRSLQQFLDALSEEEVQKYGGRTAAVVVNAIVGVLAVCVFSIGAGYLLHPDGPYEIPKIIASLLGAGIGLLLILMVGAVICGVTKPRSPKP